ncbi:MAG: VOC family protein [Alphaproteobacteria bacterium]|nr:VOC family protein [Alphaproteobacteria bacterium]
MPKNDARLDHAVVYIGRRMEDTHAMFTALGFGLTPRGYQSLGSINHLAMFGTDYLEIVGLPSDGTGSRPDLDNAPVGINGLVFKSADAQDTHAHLQAVGMAGAAPVEASRPVELDGEVKTASFRNINVRPDAFTGGRVYFCEHRTPELVWRPEYQAHRNGVSQVAEFVIVTADPGAVAADYATLLGTGAAASKGDWLVKTADVQITIQSPAAYAARFGELASATTERSTIFGAIKFRTTDLSLVRACLDIMDPALPRRDSDGCIAVRLPNFDSVLEFTA